ncbi:MAG: radical SAM protein [Treponema sp.]|jgi:threonylcarbamoyladenosine tRNA methylthiotransferase MtaB|nr:radical SAM protein [Treponema sp.]
MFSFSIHTIGCKLNQLESEALADAFRREGFPLVPWDAPPDGGGDGADSSDGWESPPLRGRRPPRRLLLVNTCTVTSMAEQKARRVIRKALREGALVLATGCYAQLNGAELEHLGAQFPGRLLVVPGENKSVLLDLPRFLRSRPADFPEDPAALVRDWLRGEPAAPGPAADSLDGRFHFVPEDFSSHSRAFLKIQDGCDRHCAFCRVRIARGESVSLPPDEVLRRLKALELRGCAEAVLTGVNICRYKGASLGLGGLIRLLLGETSRIRLRLSSLEPEDIDEELLESLKDRRLRPHFHLSIQSGSGKLLKRMGRLYGPEQAAWAVSRLREIKADPFIACDIITGFPGEGEEDFSETLEFCGRMDFAWIHGFPYSPRPGTPAWSFDGQVSQREAGLRAARLLDLARRGRRDYAARWLGRDTELVLEAGIPRPPPEGGGGFAAGTSENYLKILIPRPWLPGPAAPGDMLRCRLRPLSELPGGTEEASSPAGRDAGFPGNFDALGEPCL